MHHPSYRSSILIVMRWFKQSQLAIPNLRRRT
nr:MAG TPA: hypothetical protein [Caudoviricetes sp.]